MIVLLAGLFFSLAMSAQQLEIEESISQSNLPERNADYKIVQSHTVSTQTSSIGTLSKGYRGLVELGGGVGLTGGKFLFKLSTTHGWQFNPYLFLGAFVGIGTVEDLFYYHESHPAYDKNNIHVQLNQFVGADFRAYLPTNKISPYAGLQLGYNWSPYDYSKGLCMFGQLGVRVPIKGKHAYNIALEVGLPSSTAAADILLKIGYEF